GGALGLARAAACARAQPGSRILCLVVELCTLTFCRSDRTTANVVATALFGDGAAGAVLTTDGPGPAITAWGEHTWPGSLDVMGWHVTQKGLELQLSRGVPDFARQRVRGVTDEFLASVGLELADVDEFICHPGGSKVLEALEDAFRLPSGGLAASREILRDYGNMSAATVLFILKRVLTTSAAGDGRREGTRRYLMTGLGPGFSIGYLVLESD
ncbi:MAG: type III polyketide synthase, partial [Acidobacteria bacterium]|nr:type III polyketide synthase [Acidobacteriota bacterium]